MKIIFVCTGNTCRSPVAEGIMKKIISDSGIDAKVCSRGICVIEGSGVSTLSVISAMEYGADISEHVPLQLSQEDFVDADYVFTMTLNHKKFIMSHFPEYKNIIYSISEFCDIDDISDPFGGDKALYAMCAAQINNACKIITEKVF